MATSYSNFRAFQALTKASLQSILRSPSAVVFGLAFPLIFILVFGFLGGGRGFSVKIAQAPGSDTANPVYAGLKSATAIQWRSYKDSASLHKDLNEGNIAAILNIRKQPAGSVPAYQVELQAASSEMDKVMQLKAILESIIRQQDPEINRRMQQLAMVTVRQTEVREYKTIDFILPGQLGFSLLAGSVFGTAFVFFNLRQTLVLKRFFATPVRREIIVLSEGTARMVFQLLTAIVVISIGHFAFGFTLLHGAATFLALLALCALGILVFMGFGFIISSTVKNESAIPPFSNLITLPQFLLAGTFFPIEVFPSWLQPISRALPLTFLNDALRQVAFEGAGFRAIQWDILALIGWGVAMYFIAGRLFKWE